MSDKKRLLFVVEAMGGGVFTYIVDLANQLVERYDMYIAYAVRSQTPEDYREYFDSRIHLIEVNNFTRSVRSYKDIKAFFELRKIVKEVKPDIIHFHSSKAGVLGRWALNGKKKPMFYTPHGYSFLMADNGWMKRIVYKMIEIVSAKRMCTTISCSEGEHQETLKLTKRAVCVNNGINVSDLEKLISSNRCNVDIDHMFTVFTLGRICNQKNPVLFNKIAEAMPDIHFIWIGDGELRNELSASNIEISGWMNRKEALKKALAADMFILTSLWEGLPMSLLEAMYMKKPCVVSDVIGNHDVIHNGNNGFVCNAVSEFVASIRIVKDGKVDDLVDAAYHDILHIYNTAIMAEKYNSIYLNSLRNLGGGSNSFQDLLKKLCSNLNENRISIVYYL